jgi:hypothetical protein
MASVTAIHFITAIQTVRSSDQWRKTMKNRGRYFILIALAQLIVTIAGFDSSASANDRHRRHAFNRFGPCCSVPCPAPAPVACPAPAPVVCPAPAPVISCPAPAPVISCPAPAPVIECPAPAPVVSCPAPAPVTSCPVQAPVVTSPVQTPVSTSPVQTPMK